MGSYFYELVAVFAEFVVVVVVVGVFVEVKTNPVSLVFAVGAFGIFGRRCRDFC